MQPLLTHTSHDIPAKIFDVEKRTFAEHFNILPFGYDHHLAEHPLFELESLARLAERMDAAHPGNITFKSCDNQVTNGWELARSKAASASEAIAGIRDSESWVLLKRVQKDPEYRDLLTQVIAEIEELSGQSLQKEISWADIYIFISSPYSLTPFHIDHEVNFLFQIHGSKTAHVFDPADRIVLSEEEIEAYYMGNLSSATYTEAKEPRGNVYDLRPGTGVHQPSLAGHWMTTGPEYSVTLSIPFCMRSIDRLAKTYQFNHYLRSAGKTPTPVGQSPRKDIAKSRFMGSFSVFPRKNSKYYLLREGVMRIEAVRHFLKRGKS